MRQLKPAILAFIIILAIPFTLFAQDAKDYIRKGNEQYIKEKFNEAEINYRKSLELDNKSHKAVFNLGDALYKQEQYDKAAQEFVSIANQKIDDETTSKAYHNLGNSFFKSKKLQESIDAYKNSLRLNPKDMDTKYNLEYARRLLQQQQQQKNQDKNKDQNKQDKKNQQNQDKQNKDKQNQDKKDQKNQQQQNQDNNTDQDKQEKNQKQQGSKEQKISKKDAERILQALMQEEKKLQKKLKKKVKGVRGKVEKEW